MDGFVGFIALVVIITILWYGVCNHPSVKASPKAAQWQTEVTRWEQTVNAALEDGVLTVEEEKVLADKAKTLEEKAETLPFRHGADRRILASGMKKLRTKLLYGAAVRELLDGNLPSGRMEFKNAHFNLQRGEEVVWVFNEVKRYEPRVIRSNFSGSSMGLSVRVAKGVYLRPSMFSGSATSETSTVQVGFGMLGITTKNIYFHDVEGGKSLRIPYAKIVSFAPYKDGIGLTRDAQTAKPQRFEASSEDGWFIYNLVTNLSQRE